MQWCQDENEQNDSQTKNHLNKILKVTLITGKLGTSLGFLSAKYQDAKAPEIVIAESPEIKHETQKQANKLYACKATI